MGAARTLLILAAVIAAFSVGIPLLLRREYKVHDSGVIVITGASSGIGRHAAISLARRGYHVFAGVRKNADAESIEGEGIATLHPLTVDVAKQETVIRAAAVVQRFMDQQKVPLVGLVNNAGVSFRMPAEFVSLDMARWMFDVNVFGVISMTQVFANALRRDQGRVVMIGSVAGIVVQPTSGIYSATKFALEALTDTYRRELGSQRHGVSVSMVEPGYVKTAISEKNVGENDPTNSLTQEQRDLYEPLLTNIRNARKVSFAGADDCECTTEAITHALLDKYPHTRYPVAGANGVPANIIAWLAWALPDRAADLLFNDLWQVKK